MVPMDVQDVCAPYQDPVADVSVARPCNESALEASAFAAKVVPSYAVCVTWSAGVVPDLVAPELAWTKVPEPPGPAADRVLEALVGTGTNPREVLASILTDEMRPMGIPTIGRVLGAMQMMAGTVPLTEKERGLTPLQARLLEVEKVVLELVTPTELAITFQDLLDKASGERPSEVARFIPRKRSLTGEGMETAPALVPAVLVPKPDPPRPQEVAAYARLLLDIGNLYARANNQPAAFRLMSTAMRESFDIWTERSGLLQEPFQQAAVFQALSGQKAAEVVALYDEMPLDRRDLERRIVAQIERRLDAYSAARSHLVNAADLSAAMGDLLHTMVEDPDFARLVPENDYRRVMNKFAKVALDRGFHTEALGALAAVGDDKQLKELGDRWSKTVVKKTGNVWLVSRDVDLAIMAYMEARDFESLRVLLNRCRSVKERLGKSERRVEGAQYLDRYIEKLANLLEGDGVKLSFQR